MGDGARVLTRLMKKDEETAVGGLGPGSAGPDADGEEEGGGDRHQQPSQRDRRASKQRQQLVQETIDGDAAGGESSQACHPTKWASGARPKQKDKVRLLVVPR